MESDLQQRGRKLDDLNRQLKVMEVDAASRQSAFTEQLKEKRQSYSNAIKALQSTLGKRTAAYSQERNSLEYTIKELKFSIESIRK